MVNNAGRRGPFRTLRVAFAVGCVWGLVGLALIVTAVALHGNAVPYVLGAGFLVAAALWLVAVLQQRRCGQPDSIG